jgi:pilus assembly protein FimV
MHKLKKIVVAMSLIAPVSAYPLGVGELKLNSALNESLHAEISLVLSANEDINNVSIAIASPEKFDEAGISWHYFLSGIRFNKVSKGNNKYIIELSSNDIVQEPFLDFLLEVKWPNGNVFKSFTVLVDPATDNQDYFIEPVQVSINKQPSPVVSAKKAPKLVENDLSSLAVAGEYGPTKRNDSLWKIAEEINENQGQSVEQVMMALYKANPRAFYKKNVNALMAGKTLKTPSDADINSLSKAQANTEFYF